MIATVSLIKTPLVPWVTHWMSSFSGMLEDTMPKASRTRRLLLKAQASYETHDVSIRSVSLVGVIGGLTRAQQRTRRKRSYQALGFSQ